MEQTSIRRPYHRKPANNPTASLRILIPKTLYGETSRPSPQFPRSPAYLSLSPLLAEVDHES